MTLGTLVLDFEDQIWFQTELKASFNKCIHKLTRLLAQVGFNIHFFVCHFCLRTLYFKAYKHLHPGLLSEYRL